MPDVLPEETAQPEAATEDVVAEAANDIGDVEQPQIDGNTEVGSDEPETTAEQQAEEFLETEIFGQKGKVSKQLADSIKGILEREYSQAQEEKEQARARFEEAKRLSEEAQKYRDAVQAHLDANPEFAKSWRRAEDSKKEKDKTADLANKLEKFIAEQERQKQVSSFERELNEVKSKYPLPKNPVYTERDVKIRAADNLDRGMTLEAAWKEAVLGLRANLQKAGLSYVKDKVDAGKKLPQGGSRRAAIPSKKPEKLTPRQLLQRHLKMDERALERFK
jgi:vacuolar-type H+-ATPase subunit I/STV1